MLPSLQTLFEKTERQRQQFLQLAERMNPAQLAFQLQAGAWSLLEELHHLTLTEQEIVRLASQPELVARQVAQHKGGVPFGVVWLVLRSGIRVPVPVDSVLPTPNPSLATLTGEWEQAREQMRHLLEPINAKTARLPFAVHPVCGALTPAQVLQFTLAHGQYHWRNVLRLCRTRAFPQ